MVGRVSFAMLVSLLVGHASLLHAQSRMTGGDLSGRVLDPSGAVVPGAAIAASSEDTGLTRTALSDAEGRYTIQALPPGRYRIRADLTGFAARVIDDIDVPLGSTIVLDLHLAVSGIAENVLVAGERSLLDPHKTEIATTIAREQIEHLPISGRNFINFATITPAVAVDRTPQQGASATSGLSFSGQRGRSNNITVDGLDNNDHTVGGVRATFSQDAVREFQVLTNSFSAEFGKASGGVVNIVTRSGTNTFAGSGFAFIRDEALNAKEYFEQFTADGEDVQRDKAPYSQKQFGATLGGPIRRNRLFFFASLERLDIQANNFVTIDDRAQVLHPVTAAPLGTAVDLLGAAGFPVTTGHVPYSVESTQALAKMDFQASPAHALAIRVNGATTMNENIESFGGLVARSRAAASDSRDHMVAGGYTAVPSEHLVNEIRAQTAFRRQDVRALDPACFGLCDAEDEGGPTLEISGAASVGRHRFTPQPRRNIRYQFVDTVSYARGDHLLKAGVDFNYIDTRKGNLPLHFGGRYIFAGLPSIPGLLPLPATAMQAFALGLPAAYVQGYGNSASDYGYSDLSVFLQDDWRPWPELTVKVGVRYQNQFWPEKVYAVPGYPGSFEFPRDNNNVAPRVALAWDPTGNRTTTVHGAYGLFFDNHITGIVGIADIVDGGDGVRTLVQRIPASVAAWRAPGRRLAEPPGTFPSLVISVDPRLDTPYAHQTSIAVERHVGRSIAVAATFIAVRGFQHLGTVDYNPIVPAIGPGRRPLDVNGAAGTSASVLQYTSFGRTWYDGVTFSVAGRYAGGRQFAASYTLSNAEDNSTDFQSAFLPENNGRGRDPERPAGLPIGFDPDDERGPSIQDQRHRIVGSGIWPLPAGFQFSTIVQLGSGRPFNILAGTDLNGDGDGGAFPPDRARTNLADPSTSVPRNSGRLPWQVTVDLRLNKRLRVAPALTLDLMAEAFNLFNRTNFTEVNNIFGVSTYPTNPVATYGRFEQTAPPRQIQLGARFSF
jgi:hypothetical protein